MSQKNIETICITICVVAAIFSAAWWHGQNLKADSETAALAVWHNSGVR